MGFESRDYYRDGRYTDSLASWGVEFTPVVKYLIVANVVVFLLQIFITRSVAPELPPNLQAAMQQQEAADPDTPAGEKDEDAAKHLKDWAQLLENMPGMRVSVVQEWLELSPKKTIQNGQVWRLVTCAFCHDRLAIWHILFNMLMLYWFGTRLEQMYGSREFLLFYLTAAVFSSLAFVGLAYYSGSDTPAIGASGAVMGVMMVYTIFYPFETFYICWVIPVPLWVLLGVYVLYDLHPVLLELAGDKLFTGVAHAGHLGGLLFGFLYWKFDLRLEAVFSSIPRRRLQPPRGKQRPSPKPAIASHPQDDTLAERVDVVLKKISEFGKDSLTDEERNILVEASTQYRAKR